MNDNGETVTENAADTQPATATESTLTVEATPEPNTRKQYPTRVRRPPERWQENLPELSQVIELASLLLLFFCMLQFNDLLFMFFFKGRGGVVS